MLHFIPIEKISRYTLEPMAVEKDLNLTLWPPRLTEATTTNLHDTSAVNLLHWQRITAIRDLNVRWRVDISNSISLTFLYIRKIFTEGAWWVSWRCWSDSQAIQSQQSQHSTQSMDKKPNHRCITASEFRDVSKSNEWHEYQRINVFMALVSYSVNLTW